MSNLGVGEKFWMAWVLAVGALPNNAPYQSGKIRAV